MSSARRELAVKVGAALEAAGELDVVPFALAEDIERAYPSECAAVGAEAIRKLIVEMVQNRLKPSNPNTPRLDGFDLPARLPIPTEGGVVYRSTRRCTIAELDLYEQMLVDQIAADRQSLSDYRREKRKVVRLITAAGVDCLADLP